MASDVKLGKDVAHATALAFSPGDLSWIVCPVCRSPLELAEGQPAGSSLIRCTGCERRYPVVDGLPVLLAERAVLTSATNV